jgi:hypothetical protein
MTQETPAKYNYSKKLFTGSFIFQNTVNTPKKAGITFNK